MTRAARTDEAGARGDRGDERPPFASVDELVTWLQAMSLLDTARVCALLSDRNTAYAVSRVGWAAVYQLTRSRTYADVAEELGVSYAAVNNAVSAHLRDTR